MPASAPSRSGSGARDADSLIETVVRARTGDRAATEELIRSYQGRIARFVIAQTAEKDDYEDLCQKVFVKMVLALPRLRAADTFEAWLFTIARNVCTDHLRSRRGWRSIFVRLEKEHESAALTEPRTSMVHIDALRRALKRMRRSDRELLTLAFEQGKNYRQIARESNLTLAALKSRLFRARKMLKDMICQGES